MSAQTLTLPPDLQRRVEAYAARTGKPVQSILREAIQEYEAYQLRPAANDVAVAHS